MAKVIITTSLEDEINKRFKAESITIFKLMNSLNDEPKKGKEVGQVGGIVIKELRYKNEYLKIKNALFKAYEKMGFVPEYFGVVNGEITLDMKKKVCSPQAWSSGAMLNFLTTE